MVASAPRSTPVTTTQRTATAPAAAEAQAPPPVATATPVATTTSRRPPAAPAEALRARARGRTGQAEAGARSSAVGHLRRLGMSGRRAFRPIALATVIAAVAAASHAGAREPTTLQGERLRVGAASGHVVRDAAAGGRRALLLTGSARARGRARVTQPARPTIVVGQLLRRLAAGRARRRRHARPHPRRARRPSLRGPGGAGDARPRHAAIAVRLRQPSPHRTLPAGRPHRPARVRHPRSAPAPTSTALDAPPPATTWQWQLSGRIDRSVKAEMYDIDLFDTSAATVASLHRRGRHVVCYLDAGTYEPGRPDAAAFPAAVLGAGVEGWPGERWLDIRRLDVLGPILKRRLDLCRRKGFDGVEPDNVDAYANDSGFPLSAADQLRFNRFVAAAAHARGLSVGLKNDLDQAAALQPALRLGAERAVLPVPTSATRCKPFARAGKAVLHRRVRPRAAGVLRAGPRGRLRGDPQAPRARRLAPDLLMALLSSVQ